MNSRQPRNFVASGHAAPLNRFALGEIGTDESNKEDIALGSVLNCILLSYMIQEQSFVEHLNDSILKRILHLIRYIDQNTKLVFEGSERENLIFLTRDIDGQIRALQFQLQQTRSVIVQMREMIQTLQAELKQAKRTTSQQEILLTNFVQPNSQRGMPREEFGGVSQEHDSN